MDYSKVCAILTQVNQDFEDLERVGFLPSEFWQDNQSTLEMAQLVFTNAVELKSLGEELIAQTWEELCEYRNLDSAVMYDSVVDFFQAQAVK